MFSVFLFLFLFHFRLLFCFVVLVPFRFHSFDLFNVIILHVFVYREYGTHKKTTTTTILEENLHFNQQTTAHIVRMQ